MSAAVRGINSTAQAALADIERKRRDTLRARAALIGHQLRMVADDENGLVFAIGPRRFPDADALEAWLDTQGAPS